MQKLYSEELDMEHDDSAESFILSEVEDIDALKDKLCEAVELLEQVIESLPKTDTIYISIHRFLERLKIE